MVKITTSQNIHLLYVGLLDYLKKVSPHPSPQPSEAIWRRRGSQDPDQGQGWHLSGDGSLGAGPRPLPLPPRRGGAAAPFRPVAPRTDPCFGTPLSGGTVYLSANLLFATSKGISWDMSELFRFSRVYLMA